MKLRILDGNAKQAMVKLPAPAVGLLLRILEEIARGNAVTGGWVPIAGCGSRP